MKRNRKRGPLRFGTVAKSVFTCICIAGVGVGYVWEKNQVLRLGDEIKKRESALLAIEKRNAMLATQLAQWQSPSYLELRCQQYNLGLVSPRETQVVRLYEPGPEWDTKFTPVAMQPPAQPRPAATKELAKR
jgi:cell division protein FtsB